MPIFEWSGPEYNLLGNVCFVTHFSIDVIDMDSGSCFPIKGTVSCIDYCEHGITWKNKWKMSADDTHFTVQCDDPLTAVTWKDPETGEPHFTWNSALNQAIKDFITEMVLRYREYGDRLPSEPPKFSGEKVEYTGECVCGELAISSPTRPFPWETLTEGKFPTRCFKCSCGTYWWLVVPEKHEWFPVGDPAAWEMLLTYNGVPMRMVGYLDGEFHLMQTLVNRGLIPIPS